jgi:hypothetical protein
MRVQSLIWRCLVLQSAEEGRAEDRDLALSKSPASRPASPVSFASPSCFDLCSPSAQLICNEGLNACKACSLVRSRYVQCFFDAADFL